MPNHRSTKRDIILYLGGGAMFGVFGIGFLTRLQELNFYPRIKAIYGASAGALNGAYFLARQSEVGSSIYYEDLTHNFIQPNKVPVGLIQRLTKNKSELSAHAIANPMNLTYVMHIMKKVKPLAVGRLKQEPIKFFIEVLNAQTGQLRRFKLQSSARPWALLEATAACAPYYWGSKEIYNRRYVDAYIKEPLDAEYLLKKYPKDKIIFVLNEHIPQNRSFRIDNILEGLVAGEMYQGNLAKALRDRSQRLKDQNGLIQQSQNAYVVEPPNNLHVNWHLTKPSQLRRAHTAGKTACDQVLVNL